MVSKKTRMHSDVSRSSTSFALGMGLVSGFATGLLLTKAVQALRQVLSQPRFERQEPPQPADGVHSLEARAEAIAQANVQAGIELRRLPDGEEKLVLIAGPRNFREPWARDFGFATFGLLAMGENRVVRETLETFLRFQLPDGQLPIKIHSTNVAERYLHSLLGRQQPVVRPIRPKYLSGHRTVSLDGNALLVIAALRYAEQAGDAAFLQAHWDALRQALLWLGNYALTPDGLLHQAPFSDWADSINRQGRVLYTNVLYWKALRDLAAAARKHGYQKDASNFTERADLVRTAINSHFWRADLGYYVTTRRFDNLSSSGNLMAIAWGLADHAQANSILERMVEHGMAEPVPTRPVHRPYPARFVALENRLGGVGNYHTEAAWLWLGSWHVVAAVETGRMEEAARLLRRMAAVIVREKEVHEVYGTDGRILSTLWYTSEAPLVWSAALFVYAANRFREGISAMDRA